MSKYLLLLLITCAFTAPAQVDKTKIKAQAEEAAQALLNGNFDVLEKYTYPKSAEQFGGVEKMMKTAKAGREDLASMGITIESIVVGEPSEPVIAGDQLHCLIPQTIVIKKPDGTVTSESHLLGVSADQGEHWYFISASDMTTETIKELLPNYNPELVIPSRKPGVFKPN